MTALLNLGLGQFLLVPFLEVHVSEVLRIREVVGEDQERCCRFISEESSGKWCNRERVVKSRCFESSSSWFKAVG